MRNEKKEEEYFSLRNWVRDRAELFRSHFDRIHKQPDCFIKENFTANSYCSVQCSVVQVSSLLMFWMLNSFCYVYFISLVRSSHHHRLWRICHTITGPYCDELWKITVKYRAWTILELFTFNEWKRNFNMICPYLGHINNLDLDMRL